jgi:hypothetical protein
MPEATISGLTILRRDHLRAPRHRRRMLGAPPAPLPAGRERVSLRVDVPERLLRMTRFGLDFASEGSGWWRRVEQEMRALVDRHLPARVSEVEMRLDVDRLEVVLSYAPSSGGVRTIHCA